MVSPLQVFLCLAVAYLNRQHPVDLQTNSDHLLSQNNTQQITSTTYIQPPSTSITATINITTMAAGQQSSSKLKAKAAKSTAASTTAKPSTRRSLRISGANNNVTELLQSLNKPNTSRAEVTLESLNKTPKQSSTTVPNPAEVSPESNNVESPIEQNNTSNNDGSPTEQNDNDTEANLNADSFPPMAGSDEDEDLMDVDNEEQTTPSSSPTQPSSNNNEQMNTATSEATVSQPPTNNGQNDTSPEQTSTQPTTQPAFAPGTPATTKRSSMRPNTPRHPVPPSFAEATRASVEEVLAEQAAAKDTTPKQHTVVGPHNEHIRVEQDAENLLWKEFLSSDPHDNFSRDYHVNGFLGSSPIFPVAQFAFTTNGSTSAENMNQFSKGIKGWLNELLIVDPNLAFVPLCISDTAPANQWKKPSDVPSNFTKLGKVIQINGGSWCFDPKKDKPTNDIYANVRIKSTVPLEELLQAVSFEWKRIGGGSLQVKKHQSLYTETPYMLLFVNNRTEESSIVRDVKMMFGIAREQLREENLLPDEFERDEDDEVEFALRVNGPRMPGETRKKKKKGKDDSYDRLNDQGKKVFHLEVAKEDIREFSLLAEYCHRTRLDKEVFGKFASLTACLTNASPSGDMSRLRRCITGHLNFHLSSTTTIIEGIEDINATSVLTNPVNNAVIASKSVRDMMYMTRLSGGGPLFLQISQRSNGDVEVVIPNTAEAEAKAEMIKRNVAAYYSFVWKDEGLPDQFSKKLIERGMNARLVHCIGGCTWDSKEQVLTTQDDKTDADAIREFEAQDWVKALVNSGVSSTTTTKKKHVDPNAAFPFSDDFSVGTIHANKAAAPRPDTHVTHAADGTPILHLGKKEVIDVDDDDFSSDSVQTTKGTEAHPANANKRGNPTAVDESNNGSSGSSDEGNEDEPVPPAG